jgi:hypothetical protein
MIRYIGVTVVLVIAANLFGVRFHITYDPTRAVVITSPSVHKAASDALMTASDMAVDVSEDPADNGRELTVTERQEIEK